MKQTKKQTKKIWLGTTSIISMLSLAGCGGGSSTTATNPTPLALSASAAVSDGLTATLAEDLSHISVGGGVVYTLTLTNNTAQPITYQPVIGGNTVSRTVPATLLVTDVHGETVFPIGATAQFISVGPSTTLAPGQSVSGTVTVGGSGVGQFSAAGQYSASAMFAVQTGPDSTSQVSAAVGPILVNAQ